MARPKGVKQKRNESKYWLPEGITLVTDQTVDYNKETKLMFLDPEFGIFESCFKALQHANSSTHPRSVQKKREKTNLERYGGTNPSASKEVRAKASNTMLEKYGVKHALQNSTFLNKSKDTLESNYGVRQPMHSFKIKQKLKEKLIEEYGVDCVFKNKEIQEQIKNTNLQRYGVINPSQNPEIIEKILQNKDLATSKGENSIRLFIENELKLETKAGYIGGSKPRQLDIIVKNKNVAIEYNGVYWHSEANPNMYKNYHLDKFNSCLQKNIKLIQIFDFEWENRKQQVQSFIRSALGCNEIKLDARKLVLKEIEKEEAKKFLNDWHILGGNNPFIKAFGLIDSEHDIVSLITISIHHRNNSEFVLSRFCGKGNITVRGGLTRLTRAALDQFKELSTWIDLRFSTGESWIKTGWVKRDQLRPDYFYYNTRKGKIVSKQARKKSKVNTPDNMTEHEHALKDGLVRIYDCGKLKLVIK